MLHGSSHKLRGFAASRDNDLQPTMLMTSFFNLLLITPSCHFSMGGGGEGKETKRKGGGNSHPHVTSREGGGRGGGGGGGGVGNKKEGGEGNKKDGERKEGKKGEGKCLITGLNPRQSFCKTQNVLSSHYKFLTD